MDNLDVLGIFIGLIALLILAVFIGTHDDVTSKQIAFANQVCETNDGLSSLDRYHATCNNGAYFKITEQ